MDKKYTKFENKELGIQIDVHSDREDDFIYFYGSSGFLSKKQINEYISCLQEIVGIADVNK